MKIKDCLKKVYTKEYLILIGIGLLPLLWKVLEIAFLSSFDNALKIIGQIALISILFKIFEESILNPLFKMLSPKEYKDDSKKYSAAKYLLLYYVLATIVFSLLLLVASNSILEISLVPKYIFEDTLKFVRIYILACGVGVVVKYLYTFSLIDKDTKKLFFYLFIKSIVTTILFICLVPKFMLGMGVNGIAIAELIINIIALLYLMISFPKASIRDVKIDYKRYFKLFLLAFIETLIRNVIYYFVILVFLNKIDNQDLYFVSNEYIWSIMLVPVLAQSSLIKQTVSNDDKVSLKPYFINSIVLNCYMAVLIPVAFLVFKYVYKLENYAEFFFVLLKLAPCYFIFVIDSVIESYFIASGKLHHVLVQSILTNVIVYLSALVLYLCGVWNITLNSIIVLFNLGVLISSIYTIVVYLIDRKKFRKGRLA